MVQILYLIAFTILSILAVANLVRNLIDFTRTNAQESRTNRTSAIVPHPELLDANGNITTEPLLVMRSYSVDDARNRLDALYDASPDHDA
jgi:hypothetical protein